MTLDKDIGINTCDLDVEKAVSRNEVDNTSSTTASVHNDGAIATCRTGEQKDEGQASNTSNPPANPAPFTELSPTQVNITTAALCLNVLLSAMDQSIIATALPVIAGEFKSTTAYTWAGSAFTLALAAAGPNWGKFSDIFGRKPIMFTATIFFLIGSIMCAVAKSVGVLIAGRAVAGIGGGGINILALICISDIVPLRKRPLYIGFVSSVWAFATSIGPVLGGVFTTRATWRWCFWINVPIGAAALVVLFFFMHIKTPKISLADGLRQVDWSGMALVVPGTILFLFGLNIGGTIRPWSSPLTICCIVFGVVFWALFLINERYIPKRPIMPLRLFKSRSNLAILATGFCHGCLFIVGPYYLPLYYQAVLGASPIVSGVYLLPYNGLVSISSLGASFIATKTGRYWHIIVISMAIACLGHGLLIDLPLSPGWAKIVLYVAVAGAGIGGNFPCPMVAFQAAGLQDDCAVAIGAFAFVRTTAASASIVIGGTIFQNVMQSQLVTLQDALGPDLASKFSGAEAQANVGMIASLSPMQQEVTKAAFLHGISKIWIFYAAIAAFGIVTGSLIKNNKLHKN